MKEKIGNNLVLKIFSVIFAFLLWVFVINVDNPVITRSFSDVPVDMLNEQVLDDLNQTYTIEDGDTVSFTVRGKKDIVDQLKKSDFRATADVSSMSDVHAIPIQVDALKYKEQLEIDTGNATIKIVLEDLKSDQFPVTVKVKGEPASGYTVTDQTASPNLVSVSGPKSTISQIDEVVAEVDVSGLKKDVTTTQTLKCYDSDGEEISQNDITLDTKEIHVHVQLSRTKTVPFTVKTKGSPASGYILGSVTYKPKEIEITGNADDLDKIDEIELATLDISNSAEDVEKTIKASEIKLPDGISFVKDASDIGNIVIRANIEKQKERTLEIPVSQITLENNTDNYDVTFDDETIEVQLTGLQSAVDGVKAKDLNPKIDMSLYKEGTHTVQVQLADIDNVSIKGNVSTTITVK